LSSHEIASLLELEKEVVFLVTYYDDGEKDDVIPTRTNPELFQSDQDAIELEKLIIKLGPCHWATSRGYYQLAQYWKSHARYPKAIECMRMHISIKRDFIKTSSHSVSSSYAWALEELGDLILLHVSGAVIAGFSPERREEYCERWKPRGQEDSETLATSGIVEAYTESVEILNGVFGPDHEHSKVGAEKLARVMGLL